MDAILIDSCVIDINNMYIDDTYKEILCLLKLARININTKVNINHYTLIKDNFQDIRYHL